MTQQPITNGALALEIAPRVITIPPNNQSRAKKLRVAAYIRVSTDSDDQLNSFAAQYAYYMDLITSNPDWELVDIYADKGITGTSAEKRDDFQRLLQDCRRGRIDRVLTKSSARFARNTKESLMAARELKTLGIGVYFEEQNLNTADLSGELMTAIFALLAQKGANQYRKTFDGASIKECRQESTTPAALHSDIAWNMVPWYWFQKQFRSSDTFSTHTCLARRLKRSEMF